MLCTFQFVSFFYSGRVLKINEFTVLKKGEETDGKIGDPYNMEAIIRSQEREIMKLSPPSSQE